MSWPIDLTEYWIREDGDWLRVHKDSCRWAANRIEEDRWHGPYDTFEDASFAAFVMRRADARGCAHCLDERPLDD